MIIFVIHVIIIIIILIIMLLIIHCTITRDTSLYFIESPKIIHPHFTYHNRSAIGSALPRLRRCAIA